MEIKIGEGLGEVYFGITQKALVEILGPPTTKRRDESKNCSFYYNDLQSIFCFEKSHSGRLGWIETENPKSTFMGKRVFRMSPDRIVALVQNTFDIEAEVTDYDSFQSCCFDDIWLEFQFRFGRLRTLCFGVMFADKDRVRWPKIPRN